MIRAARARPEGCWGRQRPSGNSLMACRTGVVSPRSWRDALAGSGVLRPPRVWPATGTAIAPDAHASRLPGPIQAVNRNQPQVPGAVACRLPTRDPRQRQRCLQWEAIMADKPDVHPSSDDESDVAKFAALVDAPVTALGLPGGAANALERALGVKTVRDLAENSYVRRPQAIPTLARGKHQYGRVVCAFSLVCDRVGLHGRRPGIVVLPGPVGSWRLPVVHRGDQP
jgi:hypothetical protein